MAYEKFDIDESNQVTVKRNRKKRRFFLLFLCLFTLAAVLGVVLGVVLNRSTDDSNQLVITDAANTTEFSTPTASSTQSFNSNKSTQKPVVTTSTSSKPSTFTGALTTTHSLTTTTRISSTTQLSVTPSTISTTQLSVTPSTTSTTSTLTRALTTTHNSTTTTRTSTITSTQWITTELSVTSSATSTTSTLTSALTTDSNPITTDDLTYDTDTTNTEPIITSPINTTSTVITTTRICVPGCTATQACVNGICINLGNLAITLTWSLAGDGDLVVTTPNSKTIYHGNKGADASTDYGILDVDDTRGTGPESIFWNSAGRAPPIGTYYVCFQQYTIYATPLNPITARVEIRIPNMPTIVKIKTFTSRVHPQPNRCNSTLGTYVASFDYT